MYNWKFIQKIVNWQHQSGRKNLPWQKTNNPYFIWISEIMLQQTRVNTVIPYFNRFITKFHNISILSTSDLNTILHLWSGLGYYARAKNIYKTANIIVKKYHGNFPKDIHTLIKLPGIGKTTAGAILSLSYNFSFPILDANVKRILIRFYNLNTNLSKYNLEKKLWNLIHNLTPIHHTKNFNQGLMDLGTLICTPKNPKCNKCPIQISCLQVINKNNINILHSKDLKHKKIIFFLILQNDNLFFLEYRKYQKIWKNLFCFPEFCNLHEINIWIRKNNLNNIYYKKYFNVHYKFSNLHAKMFFINIVIQKKMQIQPQNTIWYNIHKKYTFGIPRPIEKILSYFKKTI